MHALDRAVDYFSTHWLMAGLCVIWYVFLLAGIQGEIDNWRYRRIMKRTAELRKKRFH